MPFEDKMSISYDRTSQTVTVVFRGKKTVLPGTYPTLQAGTRAGEDFCRRTGDICRRGSTRLIPFSHLDTRLPRARWAVLQSRHEPVARPRPRPPRP